jgi:hypothetical protein
MQVQCPVTQQQKEGKEQPSRKPDERRPDADLKDREGRDKGRDKSKDRDRSKSKRKKRDSREK